MDEIESIIDEITDVETITEEKAIVKKEDKLPVDASDTDEIERELVKQTKDDRKMADKIFDLFYPNLGLRNDRSEGSKEAINKALELKIMASKNLIELLKLKKTSEKNQLGVFINTMSSKKSGIDIKKLQDEAENE